MAQPKALAIPFPVILARADRGTLGPHSLGCSENSVDYPVPGLLSRKDSDRVSARAKQQCHPLCRHPKWTRPRDCAPRLS